MGGESKSKILFIGGSGYIGKFVVEASAKAGHPTYVLLRDSTLSDPTKYHIINTFKSLRVIFISGDLYDHESLVKAIKQVDVVISTVGHGQLGDQDRIVSAMKEAGNVKRFFPSEYGNDVDRVHGVEPAKLIFAAKAKIRRAVEVAKIPYTFVSSNFCSVIFNEEHDIGTYIIRAVDDPRTLNKILYVRPPQNTYSFIDLVSLWEKKCGEILEKTYVSEEQLLKNIQEAPFPLNMRLSIFYSVSVKGDQTNFDIEPSIGVEATELYSDVKYTTVDEFLNRFV